MLSIFSYYGDNFDKYVHENPTQLCSSCQWPQLSRELSMLKVQACTWWRPENGYNGDDYGNGDDYDDGDYYDDDDDGNNLFNDSVNKF